MRDILVFAGTSEGRLLCEYLLDMGLEVSVSIATEYGEILLPKAEKLKVLIGRLNQTDMAKLLINNQYEIVIDATHPYATEVTDNIKVACSESNTTYIRLIRDSIHVPNVIYVDSVREAVSFLNSHRGQALITTGSKELLEFTNVIDYQTRLTVRVLPSFEVIKSCNEMGFKGKNLICMQGPFSYEMNLAILRDIGASYLVTKEAGSYGGFIEKIKAAEEARAKVIVIKRPQNEIGYSLKEVKELIRGIQQ